MTRPNASSGGLVGRYALAPAEIERRSLGMVTDALAGCFRDAAELFVAARVVYACGDLALGGELRFSPGAVAAGVAALRAGAPLIVDVRMVAAGLDRSRLANLGCPVLCAIDDPEVVAAAAASGLPRAVEAMRLLAPQVSGAVVAIGNAPTALLALLDLIEEEALRPAMIIGLPVGFVAAAESKQELIQRPLPYLALLGSRGGSPLAAAAVNALLRLATEPEPVP